MAPDLKNRQRTFRVLREGFAQLAAYVQAEGSARVPKSYRTAEGYRLGQWVVYQRSTKDALSASPPPLGSPGRLGVGDTRETIETRTKETVSWRSPQRRAPT